MGFKRVHICDTCGYEAMVSGGRDCGFFSFTQTFECRTCRSLDDYDVGKTPASEGWDTSPVQEPICEDCNGTDLVPWDLESNGHCPQCGDKMRADESLGSILWD